MSIQQATVTEDEKEEREGGPPLGIKVGLSAGEPVEANTTLYRTAVNFAARICDLAEGGQILVSGTVHDLAVGKSHNLVSKGPTTLKGFRDPIPLFEVDWHS